MKSMIKRLIGYILAAAIVAVLVYTILGREGYTSLWPHAGKRKRGLLLKRQPRHLRLGIR